jgi:hypothetical protein
MANALWWIWNNGLWWFGLWMVIGLVAVAPWIIIGALSARDDDGRIGDCGRVSAVKE